MIIEMRIHNASGDTHRMLVKAFDEGKRIEMLGSAFFIREMIVTSEFKQKRTTTITLSLREE
jgi:hypothetical protein